MKCFHPVQAFQGSDGLVRFFELGGDRASVRSLQLSCGQCVGCRVERSRQWAVRIMHESKLFDSNVFITLTYAEPLLSLRYRDFQLFMRRIRKVCPGVRFFMCGEYGELNGRPHFHACLFNCSFPDLVYHGLSPSRSKLYRSATLEKLWPHGFSSIGALTFESAAYVARYVMKKMTGDGESSYYNIFDPSTGEIWVRSKEFCHMSLKPGIGRRWFEKFWPDVYPGGLCVVNGREVRPPKYYDRLYARIDDDGFADLAMRREASGKAGFADNSDERLLVKEQVCKARLEFMKRTI